VRHPKNSAANQPKAAFLENVHLFIPSTLHLAVSNTALLELLDSGRNDYLLG
jgi:hypothetical protein